MSALFVALGGTGYAALHLPGNSVTSRQIKNGQVKSADLASNAVTSAKVKDGSLTTADFKPGQIPSGAAGAAGPAGAPGTPGAKGDKGDPGPLLQALPSGQTLRGEWGVVFHPAAAGNTDNDAISFQFPLAAVIDVAHTHIVPEGGPVPAGCSGTLESPGAAAGNLCIFTAENSGGGTLRVCAWSQEACEVGSTRWGFAMLAVSAGPQPDDVESDGSWAVTAP